MGLMAIRGRIIDWFTRGLHATWGLAVSRILLGLFTVSTVLVNWADRDFFWGAGSAWTEPFRRETIWSAHWWGYFSATDSSALFTAKFALFGGCGLMMLVGLFCRTCTIAVFLMSTSLVAIGPTSTDTEDIIVRILLLWLCFADTSQHLSLDRWIAHRRGKLTDIGGLQPARNGLLPMWVRVPLSNMAVCLIGGQLVIVYVMAGLAKLGGPLWRDGTAIYYPFHAGYLSPWPQLSHLLAGFTPMVYFMTWTSVAIQILFPILLLGKHTRVFIVLAMLMLHIGIAVTLGLGLFSLAMCGADLVFVRDESVRRFSRRGRELLGRGRPAGSGRHASRPSRARSVRELWHRRRDTPRPPACATGWARPPAASASAPSSPHR